MNEQIYINRLEKKGVKPTAIRLLIFRIILRLERAFSMSDLENELDTVDKSTISRTLHLFLDHHLIHRIEDGSGSLKYALCEESCDCALDHLHVHFYCEKCHHTFCLQSIQVPVVSVPEGFSVNTMNYVLKGCCSSCENQKLK